MSSRILREEALDWFEEAKADFQRATRSLNDKDYSLSCYMSQQAIEKTFKALIIGIKRRSPPRVHDLVMLYEYIRDVLQLPNDVVERLPEISQYYFTARYPNAGLRRPSVSFSKIQAENALEVARYVIKRAEEVFSSR